ncbi:MAG: hypothetical protein JJU00_18490 [Opitutales bacterium]|nr:hypothetical protein [Opitutales bacterium]
MTAQLEKPLLRPKFSAVRSARRGPSSDAPERKEDIESFVRTSASRIIGKLRQSAPQEGNASHTGGGFPTRAR